MIEQKLLIGRFIELNTPTPVPNGMPINDFQLLHTPILHIAESSSKAAPSAKFVAPHGATYTTMEKTKMKAEQFAGRVKNQFDRQQVSSTGVGQSAKAHRNFRWLEWLPGKVSEANPGGMDVLTGPMSGCWIVTYLRNGVRRVGHVGTDMTSTSANSIAARTAWNNHVGGLAAGTFSGFNPFNDGFGNIPVGLPGESTVKTFALVTAAGQFYTVFAFPQTIKPSRMRIAGVHLMPNSLPVNGQI